MARPIYLDCHSTTPLDPRVFEAMKPYFLEVYGNASQDLHLYNWEASAALDAARKDLAQLIAAHEKEIIFTGCATESNHLAILGVAPSLKRAGKTRILALKIEHSSVLAPLEKLSENGFTVEWIPVLTDARVDLDAFKKLLTADVGLVSIAFANHEVGTIQDIKTIGALCKANKTLLHTDAVQAFGKIKINIQEMNIDLMSLSAHKMYGPKGVGALFVRRKNPRVEIEALQRGGSQENKLRAGTQNIPLIIGMVRAAQFAHENLDSENAKLRELRNQLWDQLKAGLPCLTRNGSPEHALPHNLNISISGIDGAALFSSLKGIAVSNASACLNGVQDYSAVLTELGLDKQLAKSSIRFGISKYITSQDITMAANEVISIVKMLRKLEQEFERVTL